MKKKSTHFAIDTALNRTEESISRQALGKVLPRKAFPVESRH